MALNLDLFSGLGVTASPFGPFDEMEDTKAGNSETLLLFHGFKDGGDQAINDGFCGHLAETGLFGQLGDQFGFLHEFHPKKPSIHSEGGKWGRISFHFNPGPF